MLDEDTNSEDNKEEANLGLAVTTSSGEEPSSNSDEDDEVISEQYVMSIFLVSKDAKFTISQDKTSC
jgi:hypothetical protein